MKRCFEYFGRIGLAGTLVVSLFAVTQVLAQGTPQTVTLVGVDPASISEGYRTSKVVGCSVVNEANQTVGTIEDLLLTPNDMVPFSSREFQERSMLLRVARRKSLKSLPDFKSNS